MTDNSNNIELKKIIAPSLSSSEYGKSIDEQFENINENFRLLSNRDFIKGDQGDGFKIVHSPLFTDGKLTTDIGVPAMLAILKAELSSNTYNILEIKFNEAVNSNDEFIEENTIRAIFDSCPETCGINNYYPHQLMMNASFEVIYKYNIVDTSDKEELIGAINYIVIKDKRFNNQSLSSGVSSSSSYANAVDLSCILCMNAIDGVASYEVIQDFPSLYYNSEYKTFCWKIGGEQTGMIAQGPAGISSTSTSIPVFKVTIKDSNYINTIETTQDYNINISVDSVLDSAHNSWVDINDVDEDLYSNYSQGQTSVVFVSYIYNGSLRSKTYITSISSIAADSQDVKVILSEYCYIDTAGTDVETSMINISSSASLKGLHVPYKTGTIGSSRHMIWSSAEDYSLDNSTGDGIDKPYLNISPINNYDKDAIDINKKLEPSIDDVAVLRIGYQNISINDIININNGENDNNTNYINIKLGNRSINIGDYLYLNKVSSCIRVANKLPLNIYNENTFSTTDDIENNKYIISIGDSSNSLYLDNCTLQSADNTYNGSTLYLNTLGGNVELGDNYGTTVIHGDLNVAGSSVFYNFTSNGRGTFNESVNFNDGLNVTAGLSNLVNTTISGLFNAYGTINIGNSQKSKIITINDGDILFGPDDRSITSQGNLIINDFITIDNQNSSDKTLYVNGKLSTNTLGLTNLEVSSNTYLMGPTYIGGNDSESITNNNLYVCGPATFNSAAEFKSNVVAQSLHSDEITTWDEYSDTNIAYVGVPIGTIVMWWADNVPKHWIRLDGSTYTSGTSDKATKIVQTFQYLLGTTATTITVPNFEGRVPMGVGIGIDDNGKSYTVTSRSAGGEYSHQLALNEIPSHQHEFRNMYIAERDSSFTSYEWSRKGFSFTENAGGNYGSIKHSFGYINLQSTGAGTDGSDDDNNYGAYMTDMTTKVGGFYSNGAALAHNNVQPYRGVYFIMKYE